MLDSHVPRRELLRRRRTLVPDGAANSTDIVPSYVPQPVVASATHRKRRADAPLKETDPNGMASSSSSSRSTRRRTSFGEINAIQNEQAETHAQASQIEALMPGKHITGSPPSDQAIISGTHPGQRAEASLELDHANTMHKKAGSHEVFACASGEHIAAENSAVQQGNRHRRKSHSAHLTFFSPIHAFITIVPYVKVVFLI
ncbi:hypothetical protein EJB05_46855 [Eragrostis curvula]|uniref:Uncharacterized protein n=1 Tax=Eragrostis curvula TaxID=38414 RepID=A0A5J9T5Z8_9POAL|nr:hypothetical protein EJB05_46855 [Eragrostis curvula]